MRSRTLVLILAVALAGASSLAAQDLFSEAGHSMSRSKWVMIRLLPAIEIALEADDVVLVQSIDHPARSVAMKIDGTAIASDCEITEKKDTEFTVASESKDKKSNWASGTTTTSTTYWARCQFGKGISDKALNAHEIIVQLAMTNGNTKPHQLGSKELRKFQQMDR
jgi:hypothetical protein